MRRAVITGSRGIVGRALYELLRMHNWHVVIVGRAPEHSWESFWTSDLSDVDAVFHLSAYVPSDMEDSSQAEACRQINAGLTLKIAEHVAKRSSAHFFFASTGQIYGFSDTPVDEEARLIVSNRACFYLSSKVLAETYVETTVCRHGLKAAIMRLGNVYGPHMKKASLIATFCESALLRQPLPLLYGGFERFDLVEVSDVATSMLRAAEKGAIGVFNIGSGRSVSVLEVAETVNDVFGSSAGTIEMSTSDKLVGRPGFAPLDITKAKRLLDLQPLSLEEGIRKYREWMLSGR